MKELVSILLVITLTFSSTGSLLAQDASIETSSTRREMLETLDSKAESGADVLGYGKGEGLCDEIKEVLRDMAPESVGRRTRTVVEGFLPKLNAYLALEGSDARAREARNLARDIVASKPFAYNLKLDALASALKVLPTEKREALLPLIEEVYDCWAEWRRANMASGVTKYVLMFGTLAVAVLLVPKVGVKWIFPYVNRFFFQMFSREGTAIAVNYVFRLGCLAATWYGTITLHSYLSYRLTRLNPAVMLFPETRAEAILLLGRATPLTIEEVQSLLPEEDPHDSDLNRR